MTHKQFRELLGAADQIGLTCTIVQLGRGNYSHKYRRCFILSGLSLPDNYQLRCKMFSVFNRIKRQSHYRRKYQAVINGTAHGPYCRKISAKQFIIKTIEDRLIDTAFTLDKPTSFIPKLKITL